MALALHVVTTIRCDNHCPTTILLLLSYYYYYGYYYYYYYYDYCTTARVTILPLSGIGSEIISHR